MCGKAIEFAVGLRYTVRNGDLLRCAAGALCVIREFNDSNYYKTGEVIKWD